MLIKLEKLNGFIAPESSMFRFLSTRHGPLEHHHHLPRLLVPDLVMPTLSCVGHTWYSLLLSASTHSSRTTVMSRSPCSHELNGGTWGNWVCPSFVNIMSSKLSHFNPLQRVSTEGKLPSSLHMSIWSWCIKVTGRIVHRPKFHEYGLTTLKYQLCTNMGPWAWYLLGVHARNDFGALGKK